MVSIVVQHVVFFVFAASLIFSSAMVVLSRNPVRGVLFLVLAFFSAAVLWMLMEAEFLALALLFVYVGAVMTLFLFVVMMLHVDMAALRSGFAKILPIGILVALCLVAIMIFVLKSKYFHVHGYAFPLQPANYSNVKALGQQLYTHYMYPFELAAVLLLVAIISAIALAFRGPRDRKVQNISAQLAADPNQRVRMVDLPRGKQS